MEIVLKKSIIREWRWEDKISLIQNANNIKVAGMVRDRFPFPYDDLAADSWLSQVVGERKQTNFTIVVKNKAVGAIGFETEGDIYMRSAEIGYWLGENYWGRGIMTEAVHAVTSYAFQSFDLCRLWAGVCSNNPTSVRVLEKNGYEFEGRLRKSITKFGKTLDQLVFAKII